VAPNAQVPKDLAALFEKRKADIVAGRFHPFTGPIKDSSGTLRVAEGKVLPESELWTMKWYADGVTGKQP